ncbi:lipopolysaccharide biosynthesis protein [Paragemmobacter straminiformis]|uniref:Membrane protein involved in the export of O-antigen and teichoic acid n=1 Tax=Paragemmobacter straminiformis TaxID=2045119 RepID=A0A842I7R7_9RHOB|nr:hypothetical protein [Gemmobacter straminiformis]MBC2835114.1 hypothetical protein [Gemmobacter straminiformis]
MKALLQSATINTWMSIVVRVGGLAVLLPVALRHLDVHQVLVWQLQSSILAMMMWIDFGLTPTFSRFIAVARGGGTLEALRQPAAKIASHNERHPKSGQRLDVAQIVTTSARVYLGMAAIGTFIVTTVGTAVLAAPITALSLPSEGWLAWLFTAISVPFALINGKNNAILMGLDRITTLRRLETVLGLFQITSAAIVVWLTSNIAWLAACYSFWTVVGYALIRRQRQVFIAETAIVPVVEAVWNPELFKVAWATAWRSGIGVLLSTGIIQGSGMLMPQLASPEAAAGYLLVLRLITVASQMSQAPFYSRLPAMAKANAEMNRAAMVELAQRGLMLSLWTMVVGVFAVLVIFPAVLSLINGSIATVPHDLSLLLSVAFFAERYGAMHMQIYTLSNHVVWHRVNGLTCFIVLAAFALLWPIAGVIAVPLALLIGYGLYLCPVTSRLALSFMQQSRIHFECRTSLGPAIGLMASLTIAAGVWR